MGGNHIEIDDSKLALLTTGKLIGSSCIKSIQRSLDCNEVNIKSRLLQFYAYLMKGTSELTNSANFLKVKNVTSYV